LPLVLIITFSSGIKKIFIYKASLVPNEMSKIKKKSIVIIIPIIIAHQIEKKINKTEEAIKTFSSYLAIIVITLILIITIVALRENAHIPHQSIIATFYENTKIDKKPAN